MSMIAPRWAIASGLWESTVSSTRGKLSIEPRSIDHLADPLADDEAHLRAEVGDVEHDDSIAAVEKLANQIAAGEAGAPRDQDPCAGRSPPPGISLSGLMRVTPRIP